jgi:CheY-like chemotaxis protein
MRHIVRMLMRFAHGDVEHRTLLDPRAVLNAAAELALHEILPRARLVKQIGELPPIEASEAHLGEVFLQLLVNAAQAIPEEDREPVDRQAGRAAPLAGRDRHEVRVAAWTDARGMIVVEVADTGVGIPPEDLARVFDPFFTTRATGQGEGLGLSFVHGVVTELGGHVEVTSIVGKGSAFRITLPPARGWRRPSSAAMRVAPQKERTRVLVIDDDPLVAEAMALALRDENDVTVMTRAREAAAALAAGARFDTILCDLHMPDMSGMDLYADILRTAPEVAGAIVFLSGGGSTPRARAFVEGVGARCLEKPLDGRELRELVRGKYRGA